MQRILGLCFSFIDSQGSYSASVEKRILESAQADIGSFFLSFYFLFFFVNFIFHFHFHFFFYKLSFYFHLKKENLKFE